jgi:uncharacterized membrane protein
MAYGPPPPGYGQQPDFNRPGWQQPPQGGGAPAPQGGAAPPPGPAPGQYGPPQPAPAPQQGPPPRGPLPGPSSGDDTTWALMAYVGQFLIGAVAPTIVFFGKGRSPFVRWHAAQGLNMGLAAIAVWLVGGLISLAVDPFIWVPLVFTAAVMFYLVYAGRAANRGEYRRVPSPIAWPLLKLR